jgi:uncharacterized protein
VNYLSQYELPFQSIKNGQHEFDLKIENKFFDFFEQESIQSGELGLKLNITRESLDFIIEFNLNGFVTIQCDICLDWFNYNLEITDTIKAKLGESTNFDTLEDYVILGKDDNKINISSLIYELIILNLPMKHEHPKDANGKRTCNRQMLKILNDLDIDRGDNIDPRWEVLNELKNKENGTS